MPEEQDPSSFAARLNYLFYAVHPPGRGPYTNGEIAAIVASQVGGISSQYISLLRNGKRDNPSLRHAEALARAFGVSADYFLSDETAANVKDQLELLVAARNADVREIMLRSSALSDADRKTILRILNSFTPRVDDSPPDEDVVE